jgi:hypothetical protein
MQPGQKPEAKAGSDLIEEEPPVPLRDHFRPPLIDRKSWDGLHGQWPAMIVQVLSDCLPRRYAAAPHVHLGSSILLDLDEYEVLVYDTHPNRRLVAAVEIVSPSNKDRPEHRRAFVAKCAALIQDHVSVTIVDLVTTRNANLYVDLLDFIGQPDPAPAEGRSSLYAATCRWARGNDTGLIQTWAHPLILGQELPTLPLWLAENRAIPLEFEASYQETCKVLRIS